MSKPENTVKGGMVANVKRGEVAVPELGDGVVIRFTVDSLERLESKYDDKENGWLINVMNGLSGLKMSFITTCLSVSIVGEDEPDFSNLMDAQSVVDRILDAMFLMLYRRTFAEQKEYEEKKQMDELTRRLKTFSEDPHRAALISSQKSENPDTKPDSDPTKSAA